MSNDLTEQTEIVSLADASISSSIAQVEIDSLISTARRFPRSMSTAQKRMIDLATLDEESAAECIYSLPRDGKTIEGPSIRFAEMAVQAWGNARVAARTTTVDRSEKFVEAEGFFLDAETNVATLARNRRRIVNKYGKLYNDDMILTTSNAAQSIARRNAILAGIPKAVWRRAYEGARHVIMGDLKTLANRRADAVKSFTRFGLTDAQVLALMGVKGVEDIDQEKLVPLRGMYSALHNQEITVEELLRQIEPDKPARVTAATATTSAPAVFANAGVPTADKPKAEPSNAEAGKAADGAVAPAPAVTTPASAADEDDTGMLEAFRDTMAQATSAKQANAIWIGFEKNMLPQVSKETADKAKALHVEAIARLRPVKQAAE